VRIPATLGISRESSSATHSNTLQHTAIQYNAPNTYRNTHAARILQLQGYQHTATHCNTLQHTATHCNTLQHTATHCNTLQHTATHYRDLARKLKAAKTLAFQTLPIRDNDVYYTTAQTLREQYGDDQALEAWDAALIRKHTKH